MNNNHSPYLDKDFFNLNLLFDEQQTPQNILQN